MKQLPLPLTEKEKLILEFIEESLAERGISPSYQEIRDHFGFASINSVQNYLKQLQAKNYVEIPPHQKRAIQILHSAKTVQTRVSQQRALAKSEVSHEVPEQSERIPLLGKVAAGRPIEAYSYDDYLDIPRTMLRNPEKSFALKVAGDSMIEDGILNGDIIVVQKQPSAREGETIVASVDNESTVKRFFLDRSSGQVELRPANSGMKSMFYPSEQVQVQGVVVGLIRKF